MSEFIDRYELVAAGFDRQVAGVAPDSWASPSPCEGWTARDVVVHVVNNHRRMIAAGTGGEETPMGAEEDPTEAWNQAYDQVRRLTRDSEALQKPVNGPGGPVPLEQALGTLVSMDTHVHTWDLARSVGGDVRLDPGVVAFSMALLGPMDAMIRQPGFFDAKVEPPAGADEQTELLCFLGRQV